MNQEIDYKNKYLKYKSKLFNLKKSIGGSEKSNDSTVSWMNEPNINPKSYWVPEKYDLAVIQAFPHKYKDGTVKEKEEYGYTWFNNKTKPVKKLRRGIKNKSPKEVIDSLFKEFIGQIFNIEYVDDTSLTKDQIRAINLFRVDVGEDKKNKLYFRLIFGEPQSNLEKNKGFPYELGFNPSKSGGIGKKIKPFFNFKTQLIHDGSEVEIQKFFIGKSKGYIDGKSVNGKKLREKSIKFLVKIEDFINKLLQSYVTFILVKPDLLVPQYSIEPFIEKIKKLWEKSYEFFKKIKIDS